MPGGTRVAEGHLKFSLRVLSDKFRKRNSKNMHGAFSLVVSEVIGPRFAGSKLGTGPKKDPLVEQQQELLESAADLRLPTRRGRLSRTSTCPDGTATTRDCLRLTMSSASYWVPANNSAEDFSARARRIEAKFSALQV
jgi:hypothetical protein